MGMTCDAVCDACGHRFEASQGGGFFFHLLHCERCGREKSIGFDEIEAAVERGDASSELPAEAARFDEAASEQVAGRCQCRGHYRVNAPVRCPKCRSSGWTEVPDGRVIMYD